MKRLFFFGMIVSALMIISCGGGNQQAQQNVEDDEDSTDVYVPRDQTIYGICGNGTAMNTLQLLTDNGDTLSLDLIKAQENNQVFGGLQAGDRMAVLPNKGKTEAVIVINQNTLWVTGLCLILSMAVLKLVSELRKVVSLRALTRVASSTRPGRYSMVSWRSFPSVKAEAIWKNTTSMNSLCWAQTHWYIRPLELQNRMRRLSSIAVGRRSPQWIFTD